MAALTPVDIANMALGLLTEAPIDSLDEDSRAARMMNLHYETTREAELSKSEWVFARMSMPVEAQETGDPEWPYGFELPTDCLRPLPTLHWGREIEWRLEGSSIQAKFGGIRTIRYIANLIDPNDWPAVFTDVFAAALAVKVAHPITGKANMTQVAQQAYSQAFSTALRLNAVQKGNERRRPTWIEERQGRHGYAGWSCW